VKLQFHARATAVNAVALFLALLFEGCLACAAASAAPQSADQQDPEVELGTEVYDDLKSKGQIVASSPLYATLEPIATRITKAAQPSYPHPFRFYLVHQTQPNAFSTPGGNVYVADSLLYFVKNTEELAGTLCHEVAHTIHHDTMVLAQKRQRLALREVGADVILGPTPVHILAMALLGKLNSLGYSRDVESRADVTGSDICASAQYNPWGLVWLFADFENANIGEVPELLSDHPGNAHRVATLKEHYRKNPQTFARFDPDAGSTTPFHAPAEMAETFVH
jgi:predicted Zn-dependent protease